jgi:hypothetical protein
VSLAIAKAWGWQGGKPWLPPDTKTIKKQSAMLVIPHFCLIFKTFWNFYAIIFDNEVVARGWTMIDWFSGLIGYDGSHLPKQLSKVCEVSPSGEIKWIVEKAMTVQGSYDSSIQLKVGTSNESMIRASQKHNFECEPVCLAFSGNPSKYLQGHNVFGPSVSALGPVLQETVRKFPEAVRPRDADIEKYPAVHRSTVDMNTMVDFGSHAKAHEYLRFLEHNARSRHGRALVDGDTVYFGQHSRRWALKLYCKFCELKAHPPADADMNKLLGLWTEGQLRIELRLKTPELKDRGTLSEDLIWEYFSKIEVSAMKENVTLKNAKLSRIVQLTLSQWMAGADVRHLLTKPTFYRHRLEILKATGLDISLPCADQQEQVKKVDVDLDYLKSNEIKKIPSVFQQWLFVPDPSPTWDKK